MSRPGSGSVPGRGIPTAYVRRHIERVMHAYDITPAEFAREAGVSRKTVMHVLNGDFASVYGPTSRKILRTRSVPRSFEPSIQRTMTGVPTRRRLEALSTIGHTRVIVANATGIRPGSLMGTESFERVRIVTHMRVKAYYDVHRRRPLTSGERSMNGIAHARRRGWAPPWAWPHRTIDDLMADPAVYEVDDDEWRANIIRYYDLTRKAYVDRIVS